MHQRVDALCLDWVLVSQGDIRPPREATGLLGAAPCDKRAQRVREHGDDHVKRRCGGVGGCIVARHAIIFTQ